MKGDLGIVEQKNVFPSLQRSPYIMKTVHIYKTPQQKFRSEASKYNLYICMFEACTSSELNLEGSEYKTPEWTSI